MQASTDIASNGAVVQERFGSFNSLSFGVTLQAAGPHTIEVTTYLVTPPALVVNYAVTFRTSG